MTKYGRVAVVLYALAMLMGGIGGYVQKHSLPSLISGIGSAILLLAAAGISVKSAKKGFGLATGTAALLVCVFILRSVQTASEPHSLGRNVGLALFSAVAAALFAKCMSE